MKKRKITVFWTIHITFTLILILIAFFAIDSIESFGPVLVFGILVNGAVYITGNVADAWQISKNYKWQLDPGMKNAEEKK